MNVIVGSTVVLTVLLVGVLIGMSAANSWIGRRIHTVGAERRGLSEERAEIVDAWTELAEQRRELDLMRRTIDG